MLIVRSDDLLIYIWRGVILFAIHIIEINFSLIEHFL